MRGLLAASILLCAQISDRPDPPIHATIKGEVTTEADGRGGTLGYLLLERLGDSAVRAYRLVITDARQASLLDRNAGRDVVVRGLQGERATMPYLFVESISAGAK